MDLRDSNLTFTLDREPGFDRTRVFLYHRRSNGRTYGASVGDHGNLMFEEVPDGEPLIPLMVIGGPFHKDFMRAMATFLEDEGMVTSRSARLQALVDEKQDRIQDLREEIQFLRDQLQPDAKVLKLQRELKDIQGKLHETAPRPNFDYLPQGFPTGGNAATPGVFLGGAPTNQLPTTEGGWNRPDTPAAVNPPVEWRTMENRILDEEGDIIGPLRGTHNQANTARGLNR